MLKFTQNQPQNYGILRILFTPALQKSINEKKNIGHNILFQANQIIIKDRANNNKKNRL